MILCQMLMVVENDGSLHIILKTPISLKLGQATLIVMAIAYDIHSIKRATPLGKSPCYYLHFQAVVSE